MRCRIGDNAFIVKSADPRNIGKVVTVLGPFRDPNVRDWWVCSDSVLHGIYSDWPPGAEVGMFDLYLQPIRDQPGTDQMILRAGLPERKGLEVTN